MPVRIPKAKQDRTKEMFTMHMCTHGGKSRNTTTLEELESKDNTNYLYIAFDEHFKFEKEFRDVGTFVASLGYEICALTETSIEMACMSNRFSRYQDWKSKFKITKQILTACFARKALNVEAIKSLLPSTDKIKDKFLTEMLEEYKAISKNGVCEPPEMVMKMVTKELKEFTDNDAELTKVLNKSYPLIGAVSNSYAHQKAALANELVTYINSKL
jgi:hypothetical protein